MSTQIKNNFEFNNMLKNYQKLFLIAGKNSFIKSNANNQFINLFKKKKLRIYFKQQLLPNIEELEKILKIKEKFKPDLIIAIGGGSVMDLSKIASVFENSKNFKNKILNNDFLPKKTDVLAIPTTAGSGAETTSNAVIYINKVKFSVEDKKIIPNYFFLIPELILSSSKKIDASAGFDAISQSIESIFSKKSTDESIFYASKALKILIDNYEDFYKRKNLFNSQKMMVGANLAGKAINISKTITPHAISYPITAHFGIKHGHAVSLTLNEVLKFNFFNQKKTELKKKYDLIFKLTKTRDIFHLDKFINHLKKNTNLNQNFEKLGINLKKNLNLILNGINEKRLLNNPIKINVIDIKKILNRE